MNPTKDQYLTTLAQLKQLEQQKVELERKLIAQALEDGFKPEFELGQQVETVGVWMIPLVYITGYEPLVTEQGDVYVRYHVGSRPDTSSSLSHMAHNFKAMPSTTCDGRHRQQKEAGTEHEQSQ